MIKVRSGVRLDQSVDEDAYGYRYVHIDEAADASHGEGEAADERAGNPQVDGVRVIDHVGSGAGVQNTQCQAGLG